MNLLTILAQAQAPSSDGGSGAVLIGGAMVLLALLIGVAALVFWIWALIDAIRNPSLNDTERIVWVLVIVLTSWLGALIYYLVGRTGTAARSPSSIE